VAVKVALVTPACKSACKCADPAFFRRFCAAGSAARIGARDARPTFMSAKKLATRTFWQAKNCHSTCIAEFLLAQLHYVLILWHHDACFMASGNSLGAYFLA
jgi:hypothetical protein